MSLNLLCQQYAEHNLRRLAEDGTSIQCLFLLREGARSRLEIATYDETIRFNIILIDDEIGVVQPYLPALRGIDSPTFVLRRRWQNQGLFPVFEAIVSSLWTRARTV